MRMSNLPAEFQCAECLRLARTLEAARRADKKNLNLQLRMGIHSGPINEITDVNDRTNVTGAGINMAHRLR